MSNEAKNVFTHDVGRLNLTYESKHLRPEPAVIVLTSSSSGVGSRLTREAPAYDINGLDVCASNVSDVSVAGDVGPVLGKDSSTEVIVFYLPFDLHAGTFEAEV